MQTNKTRKSKYFRAPERRLKTKSKASKVNLSINYELMLKLYLLNKEQASSKEELKYYKAGRIKNNAISKASSSSVWNNLLQVLQRANGLLHTLKPA